MKSYTDIPQSRKLVEILPLESADMYYDVDSYGVRTTPEVLVASVVRKKDVPCWSLAALLDVLPKNLNIGRPSLDSNYMGYYWIQYYDEFMKPNNYKTECFNNPIDACVEMIIKLHEQKLL